MLYHELKSRVQKEIKSCQDLKDLENLRIKYLSRKGIIAVLFKNLASASVEEKPGLGKELNALKVFIDDLFEEHSQQYHSAGSMDSIFDPTLPAHPCKVPRSHPIKQVMQDITDIFTSMGFGIAYGPEIENNYYNFAALNFPEDHPARDMHDTLYLKENNMLLRTHTSPVQIRMMEKYKPPYKFIAPGKCYRRDTIDSSHSPVFHQIEGLMIDTHINFANLKGILDVFAKRIFSNAITRFRPSFFPFTEPSAEMDIMCGLCSGKGCPSCSGKGWLEILGAGMVDPEVLKSCKIDSEVWQGFAFGMGIERIAMLKYNITDMRLFYQNDLRFLEQF